MEDNLGLWQQSRRLCELLEMFHGSGRTICRHVDKNYWGFVGTCTIGVFQLDEHIVFVSGGGYLHVWCREVDANCTTAAQYLYRVHVLVEKIRLQLTRLRPLGKLN